MKKFEEKYTYCWLLLGLFLAMLSYGILNTGICAWIFAIPLIRYINIRPKWSSILLMLLGTVVVANITFWGLVRDGFNIMNQVFCTFNGIRIWFPFFVYFLCRKLKTNKLVGYFAFPAAVAVAEFFIDNPFVSVMTSLSVSQFWNIGLMQLASVTGVVGVSFIVTLCASVVNYIWEEGLNRKTAVNAAIYGVAVVLITGIGMSSVTKITTGDQTVRVAASIYNTNYFAENLSVFDKYEGDAMEKIVKASIDVIDECAKDAAYNGSTMLVFPEDAFSCSEDVTDEFIGEVKKIAKENQINILFPLLKYPDVGKPDEEDVMSYSQQLEILVAESGKKKINTLNFIGSNGELRNTYVKNHLVPVVEEPFTEKGDGKTPIVEVDGVKYTYLICADYTSNKYAYNGREADIFLNPSYDWEAFQYFTSYGVQARAIECGFSVLRNPVNGNIILYDYYGRPLHMENAMNVHTGMIYLDIPKEGRQTFYEVTGNWFPWLCAAYSIFSVCSGFVFREKDMWKKQKMNSENINKKCYGELQEN